MSSNMVDTSSIPRLAWRIVDDVRWLNEREERAWRALQFMQMRLEGELARQLAADSGLSYPDYLVLVALTDRPDGRMRAVRAGGRPRLGEEPALAPRRPHGRPRDW